MIQNTAPESYGAILKVPTYVLLESQYKRSEGEGRRNI